MRSAINNYMGMIAIAIVAVLVIGAVGVRIDRSQEQQPPAGINATPAITGNAPNGLVDVRWLMQYRAQVDYIFDLSDQRQYEAGHIPGAQHIWWQDAMALHVANYAEPDRISNPSADMEPFNRLNLKVPQNSRIVLYDNNGSERASWMLWVMTINGYTDVHVLDGGLQAWVGADGELSLTSGNPRDPDFAATPTWNEDVQIRREALLESLDDPNLRIIDTRSSEELEDTANGTVREGHIPGAINIPTSEVMRADGTFKSPEELRDLFQSYGIDPENRVTVYSLYTAQSGTVWLALQIAGYNDAVIYMEGFVAWGYNEDLPLETGTYPTAEPAATPESAVTPVVEVTAEPSPTPEASPDDEGPTDLTGEDLEPISTPSS